MKPFSHSQAIKKFNKKKNDRIPYRPRVQQLLEKNDAILVTKTVAPDKTEYAVFVGNGEAFSTESVVRLCQWLARKV